MNSDLMVLAVEGEGYPYATPCTLSDIRGLHVLFSCGLSLKYDNVETYLAVFFPGTFMFK